MKNTKYLTIKLMTLGLSLILVLTNISCVKNNQIPDTNPIKVVKVGQLDFWLTKGDQSILFEKQKPMDFYTGSTNNYPTIEIDTVSTFQSIDGFGYTLTGGSAGLIHKMGTFQKNSLLNDLFLCGNNKLCISYLRISLGASDLDETVFSYNDIDVHSEDTALSSFSLSKDTMALIPVLKEILKINPSIKIMASPWSAPLWMKSNKNSVGGALLPKYYDVYARYFVKYIQEMQKHGIVIDAVTVQNEPEHGGNNPSMLMKASEQNEFVKKHLGPAFKKANLNTKIVIWDHNCDNPQYPISILNDSETKPYVDGSAFHLYAGNISALSTVHNAHPDKSLYFTEQWTGSNGTFSGDLLWHTKNVVIGSLRHWGKVVLEWNLANDPGFRPHTPGGCTQCKGALTIAGNVTTKNVSYYIIAHASAFIPPGSKRIASTELGNIHSVTLLTPDNQKVLIAVNESKQEEIFNISFYGKKALASIPPESTVTYLWK
jgi:glucosylceramidase